VIGLLSKYKYLSKIYLCVIPIILYLFNIREIVFPKNYQQDDVRELNVSNFLDFSCVINQGDNHPLWSYLIWGFSKLTVFELGYIISVFNICLLFGAIYFIFQFSNEKYGSSVAILVLTLLVSSPSVITYSVSLKQYMLELFYSSYCLYVSKSNETIITKFNSKSFYLISIFFVLGSLVNASIFIFLVMYYLIFIKFNISIIRYLIFSGLPILFFLNRILEKINRDSYNSYWENFFISNTVSSGFFNKLTFIFNMIFKSYFGFIYSDRMLLLLLFIILFSIFLNLKSNLFSKYLIFLFLALNFLQLYPLGTGRTDIILFPFYLSLIAEVIFLIKTKINSNFINLITFIVLLLVLINGTPFYKQEQIYPALVEIKEITNNDTAIVVASEQYNSFEYYGQKVFGIKEIVKNNCYIKSPKVENYFTINRKSIDKTSFNNKISEIVQFPKILMLGIELDSRGVFRDFEDAIFKRDYILISSTVYPEGFYFNVYEFKE